MLETDANGQAEIKRLPSGTYTLLETVSPSGYLINKDIPSFYVGDSHTAVIVADQPSSGGSHSGGGGGGSGGGGGGTPTETPTTTIPENQVPLANLPNQIIENPVIPIDDMEVPLGALPKTGDFAKNHGLMAIITATLALFLLLSGKKKEDEDG
ncbi:doubled motif LPXTG anchor domain-containing protein [Clostridium sp. AM58-1XD]|uniref:doubled motif LPXTG anchor domain-containing protein n=1 Tax=Clostridium sp. AM58-1XD TaxID=2292307 RepID=UPI0015F4A71C